MKASTAIPILRVKDARFSEAFYRDKLGFTKDWEHQFEPGFPILMSISNGSVKLFLSEHGGTGTDRADLYLYVPDLNALHGELVSRDITFEQPPTDQPWGVRDMQMRDPDGHRFTFATTK